MVQVQGHCPALIQSWLILDILLWAYTAFGIRNASIAGIVTGVLPC